jgi:PAS domain S-box-containing protein
MTADAASPAREALPSLSGGPGDELAALRRRLDAAEAELATLRRRCADVESLRAVVDVSPMVAIRWRLEPGWPVEYVSPNIARFGYAAQELTSGAVSWFDVLLPAERRGRLQVPDAPDLIGEYRLLTYALQCRPSGRRLVRFVIRTVKDAQDRLVCEGMFREASERMEDEERLRLLEQAINTATNGIVIADAGAPDHPVIFANRAVQQISGYEPEEFLGRNCRFLQGAERKQPGLERVRAALQEGRSCDVVLRNYRKNGTLFWNEVRLSPVTNGRGEVTHFIGVQADITARKTAEAALARRDGILEAVSRAAETLLRNPEYERALPTALRQIGEVTGADHLCVWRQGTRREGRTLNLLEVWTGPQVPPHALPDYQQILWEESAGWPSAAALREGRWVQGGLGDCTPEERALVERLGMRSFLCLPIFDGPAQFWGALTLASRRAEVVWAPIEVEALLSATRVLGAMIRNRSTALALRASEQRFRALVNNLKEIVFQTDAEGTWTYLNRSWTEVTGFPLAESVGRSFLAYVHPDDRERNTRLFEPLVQRRKEYCRHRVRYLTKSGGFRWIEVFARLTLDDQDRITGTAGTLTDVTAQVEAEDTRRRQLAAIEAAIDGVGMLNDAGEFTGLNSTHLALFGYDGVADLLGRSWRELYDGDQAARLEAEALPALAARGKWRGVLKARRRDGTTFDEELSLTSIEGGGMVRVCRDVSESRRTAERIERSLREKEVLLKEIHHRVKNNLQIVSSLLNLQIEHVADAATRSLFLDSQSRIASMALIHEKLYQSADLGRIAFAEYVRELLENLVGSLRRPGRGIQFRADTEDLHLGLDTAIPCGLLINELVSNAYKHAFPDGRPGMIELRLAREPAGGLVLEVADTGCGLPAGLDLRQTRTLGLQLVHTLVQQLRGTIEVRRGAGTRFVLHLQEAPPHRP